MGANDLIHRYNGLPSPNARKHKPALIAETVTAVTKAVTILARTKRTFLTVGILHLPLIGTR